SNAGSGGATTTSSTTSAAGSTSSTSSSGGSPGTGGATGAGGAAGSSGGTGSGGAQADASTDVSPPRDAGGDAGPAFDRAAIIEVMKRVAGNQLAEHPAASAPNDWIYGAFYTGL